MGHILSQRLRTSFIIGSILSSFFALSAAGYYNLGIQWKGGLNPHRLGSDIILQSGFTSGLGVDPVPGTGPGILSQPSSVAVDSSGNIFVADSGNHRVSKYNS